MSDTPAQFHILLESADTRVHRFITVEREDHESSYRVVVRDIVSKNTKHHRVLTGNTTEKTAEYWTKHEGISFYRTLEEANTEAMATFDKYCVDGWMDVTTEPMKVADFPSANEITIREFMLGIGPIPQQASGRD